ncbi:MAG: hypothetical protein AAGK32_01395, partial [Actinomycetota bacterium]
MPAHRRAVPKPTGPRGRPPWLRVTAVLAAAVVLAGACTDDDDSAAGDAEGTPAALALAEESAPGVDLDGDPLLRASTGTGRDAAVAWRDAPYEVEVKGGGAYVGHELLSSADESEIPWSESGDGSAGAS